jgi:2-acylglycerol O-acyltransferase 2
VGTFGNFVSDYSDFRDLFPGIRPRLATLNFHFFVPVFREIPYGWGLMSVKKKTLKNALSQSHDPKAPHNKDGRTANAIALICGGAQEALTSRPGIYRLILKKRKGFCKVAIETGASLVPVFGFNEVDVYDQPSNEPGTTLRKFQDLVKKWTGIAPACFIGRGFLQYSYGIIPRRVPITTVVGCPIDTVKTENPTQKDIDDLHEKFTDSLIKLFEDNKHKYLQNPDKTHLIVE